MSIYVSQNKVSTKLFRVGIYLFTLMTWVSKIGYGAFPLADAGAQVGGFQEFMHVYVVTTAVVLLSIVSLGTLIVAGQRDKAVRPLGICAAVALAMMLVGAIGRGIVPLSYFGVVERFSVFAAVGYNAVLGLWLFAQGS